MIYVVIKTQDNGENVLAFNVETIDEVKRKVKGKVNQITQEEFITKIVNKM